MTQLLKDIINHLHSLRPASISLSCGEIDVTAEFIYDDEYDNDPDFTPDPEREPKPQEAENIEVKGKLRLAAND